MISLTIGDGHFIFFQLVRNKKYSRLVCFTAHLGKFFCTEMKKKFIITAASSNLAWYE